MSILVITYTRDNISVSEVIDRLRSRGEHVFRLDTDTFPGEVSIAARSAANGLATVITSDDDEVRLQDVTAIWYRRNHIGRSLPPDMPRELRSVAINESRTALFGAIDALSVFQVDAFWTVRRAAQKPRQIALAQSLGLRTPETLITNDPDAVRAFANAHGPLVFKPVSDIVVADESVRRVWTNRLDRDELASLDGLDYSPMIFQVEIPKRLELRATIIGRQVFTASVDPAEAGADDDWRKEGAALLESWSPYDLPRAVEEKLLAMMDRLELNYGAADLILSRDGDYVFLEINPCGEFCWLDKLTSLPLGDAMAELLLNRHALAA